MILIVRCYKISTYINFLAFSFSALVPTKFVIKPEISVTAYTARDFTLKCDIFGHPTPVVTWKRTHGELPVSRHVISGNKLTLSLALLDRGICVFHMHARISTHWAVYETLSSI